MPRSLPPARSFHPACPACPRTAQADNGVFQPPKESSRGHLGLRPLLGRHRPVQLPHGGPDAGRPDVRAPPEERGAARAHHLDTRRAVRLPRRDGPRPWHPEGGPARPGGRVPADGRRGDGRRPGRGDPLHRPDQPARDARDRLRLRRGADPAPPQGAPVPRQRDDDLRVRQRGRPGPGEDVLLGRRRLRGGRGRGGGREPDRPGRHGPAPPVPHRRRAAPPRPRDRPLDLADDAGERAGLAHRGGDPRRAAGHLAGHAGLRLARHVPRGHPPRRPQGPPPRRQLGPPTARRGRPSGPRDGVDHALRDGGQRGERGGRPRGHRPHQRRGGHHPGRPALLHELRLPRLHRGREGGQRRPLPPRRRCDRPPLQGERLHLRRRGRLPGRGRLGLLHGGRRSRRGPGRFPRAGGERRRDRHGAQPRPDLRPGRRASSRSPASSATAWRR